MSAGMGYCDCAGRIHASCAMLPSCPTMSYADTPAREKMGNLRLEATRAAIEIGQISGRLEKTVNRLCGMEVRIAELTAENERLRELVGPTKTPEGDA